MILEDHISAPEIFAVPFVSTMLQVHIPLKKLTRITRLQETTGCTNVTRLPERTGCANKTYHEHDTRGASKGDEASRICVHFESQEAEESKKKAKAQRRQETKAQKDAEKSAWRDDIVRQCQELQALKGHPCPAHSEET